MIAILGAGPHGRSIKAFPEVCGYLYDDNHEFGLCPIEDGAREHPWVIGAAWPWVRRGIAERLKASEYSMREPYNRGIITFDGARVPLDDMRSGDHVHICQNAVVSHGCVLGSFVTVCPGAVLAGEVTVGDGVLVGANATVIHGGITIGRNAVIGAGAVVTHDVPEGAVVVGNPARAVVVE